MKELKPPGIRDSDLFGSLMPLFPGRTAVALDRQYYKLTNKSEPKIIHKIVPAHNDFLEAAQRFHDDYQSKCAENIKLFQRVQELETQLEDYKMMARIMEQARKIIVAEELGVHEKPRFKMDSNGNLDRV